MTSRPARTRTPADELLPLNAVLEEIGITRASWYRWQNKGQGPKSIRLPNGHLRVRRSELTNWLNTMEEAA
ncbi:putative DNA-binding transcriptional regulator AlpA [Streptacidiphilus sp. BW17]|uniref:helix-turn-helix transcriptional regulator n=1 Tax=Streptacidiphilus sp. BW17 TaxID=3156274 RepID=UPI00351642A3